MKLLMFIALLGTIGLGMVFLKPFLESVENEKSLIKVQSAVVDVDRSELELPVISVPEPKHEFGTVDPGATYSHIFQIKNTGSGDLILRKGRKTCTCASLEIIDRVIAPDSIGRVKLNWEARSSTDEFNEGFSLQTNDPNAQEVFLRAAGRIKVSFWGTPGDFNYGPIESGSDLNGISILHSQLWNEIEIKEVSSSLPGLNWTLSETTDLEHRELDATASRKLEFSIPEVVGKGEFNHYVRIVAASSLDASKQDWLTIDLRLRGHLLGKYQLLCDKFDYKNRLDFRSVRSDQGAEATFMLKIAAKNKILAEPTVDSYPPGIEVDWKPVNLEKGVYHGKVLIPPGLDNGNYQQETNQGWVTLSFDNPDVGTIKIPMVVRLYQPSKEVGY